jgi:hypothetical protein
MDKKVRQNITVTNTAYSVCYHELPAGTMSETYELGMKLMLLFNGSEVFTVENVTPLLLARFGRERLQEMLAEIDTWIEHYA